MKFGKLVLFLVASVALAIPALAQVGSDTPTGAGGSFGGTIESGSGNIDPYELNASRSVVDITVPGTVLPFTYTRIWNSRGGAPGSYNAAGAWRSNWDWAIEAHEAADSDVPKQNPNDWFFGYYIYYPDGRVVNFNKQDDRPDVGRSFH